jgi:signal recognition particle subunit SRP54
VEKAAETVDRGKAEKLAKKLKKGDLDFNDLAEQLSQMRKMGGMQGLLGMLPGVGRMKDQLAAAGLDDHLLKRQEAIISSMTRQERTKPDIINGSRRKRIAAGAGVEVSEVNKVIKMQRQMADVMKKIGRGGRGLMQALGGMNPQMLAGLGGGGMPPMPPGLDSKK